MKTSIILPTYNEKDSILDLVEILILLLNKEKFEFEIIVVDDDSPDKTGYLVNERYSNYENISCIIRKNERGLASALKTGIERAEGDAILLMDTDFNHDPFVVPQMIRLITDYDIVSGSRYIKGGGMMGSKLRYWGSYLFNHFIRIMIGVETKDNLSGFVIFRRDILKDFDLDEIFTGYGDYYIKFLYRCKELDLRVCEIPVVYKLRQGGSSKTNFVRHLIGYIITVLKIKLDK
ncbi:MAG: glycosyltransferase [Candidatus Schekmanbacteria bacterium]|nr:MAG: glycosyltransferase [Candidatus Schekmanbacteria bacterium]